MSKKRAILKEGREKSLDYHHPWIFSGALQSLPNIEPGEILPLYTSNGRLIGQGYFNPLTSLAGRMINFGHEGDPIALIRQRLHESFYLKQSLYPAANAFRWINAEGDGIPGLIVDWYAGIAVFQIHTAGMERISNELIKTICEIANPQGIFERSDSASRTLEGLSSVEKWHLLPFNWKTGLVLIQEENGQFFVSIEDGQKTGFFLDQRESRTLVARLAKGKKVLNAFGYTGGFTIAALLKGASHVDHVDVDTRALELVKQNLAINHLEQGKVSLIQQDVFTYLEKCNLDHDIIILDPPAFAKKLKDKEAALKGYAALHRLVFAKAKSGTLVHTSSCSYFLDEESFTKAIFQAALATGREVSILSSHHGAFDHPCSIYCPEGKYLKSYLLCIRHG